MTTETAKTSDAAKRYEELDDQYTALVDEMDACFDALSPAEQVKASAYLAERVRRFVSAPRDGLLLLAGKMRGWAVAVNAGRTGADHADDMREEARKVLTLLGIGEDAGGAETPQTHEALDAVLERMAAELRAEFPKAQIKVVRWRNDGRISVFMEEKEEDR